MEGITMEKEENKIPMGLGFGLATNEKAMNHFAMMGEEEKTQVIEAARGVQSKKQMQQLIQNIAELDKSF